MTAKPFVKYSLEWPAETDPLSVEFWCIRKGKQWIEQQGRTLFHHYRAAEKLLWPEDDQHRWSDLSLQRMLENEIVIMLGCGASNKTYRLSKFALTDWWAFPDQTLWLISSTEFRGADLRIWGDIQLLFNRALKRRNWLAGYPLLSLHTITNQEEVEDDADYFKAARSLKRGLIVVPNKKGNTTVGLGPFIGIRVPRLRHAGDEVQMMSSGFADSYSNWIGNSDFHGYMAGNPIDITDQLCTLSEPIGGWDHWVDTEKTQEWTAKWFNAHVIAFDGRDSPNLDFPNPETSPRYPYLIGPKKLRVIEETYGKDSWNYYSQCAGKPNKGGLTNRVVTRQLCEKNRALEQVSWMGKPLIQIYGLDPNYGGRDRCVGGLIEFGQDIEGSTVVGFHQPEIIPVKPVRRNFDPEPEEQIARYVHGQLQLLGIPFQNAFYDATGKGTLGMAFAQVFGSIGPVALDSGAKATERPVRFDLFVEEKDGRRLKRCDEHYLNWVTEAWFSVGEAIRSKQVRNLPVECMKELCLRMYIPASNNRIQIEPKTGTVTRPGFNERVGYSPDFGDWSAICVEGARQRGFRITRLGEDVEKKGSGLKDWFATQRKKKDALNNRMNLLRV